jgi:cell division protein ZapE
MLLEAYAAKIERGELHGDPAQAAVVSRLAKLAKNLEARDRRGVLAKLVSRNTPSKGIYIHGDVGRGKTMLMDLFFANLQVRAKQRIHFHGFMQDIHRRRQSLRDGDVVAQIAGQNRHTCFALTKCRSAISPMP